MSLTRLVYISIPQYRGCSKAEGRNYRGKYQRTKSTGKDTGRSHHERFNDAAFPAEGSPRCHLRDASSCGSRGCLYAFK